MNFFRELFECKKKTLKNRLNMGIVVLSIMVVVALIFGGKTKTTLDSIAVCPNEQYVACFEDDNRHTIHCFQLDGSPAFALEVSDEVSGGGSCALWFEDDVLCVWFYKANNTVHITLDGKIVKIIEDVPKEKRSQYPSFARNGHQYTFNGSKIDVVYDEAGFWGYWFLGSERYLAITPPNGETKIVWSVSAT